MEVASRRRDFLDEDDHPPQSKDSKPSYESSRIIVKNLPKRITAERIKGHFGVKGSITDVRLASTPDGRSRGFAFVGFASGKEANDAVKYFDRTFMDTSRLQVELAKPRNDPSLDRPWSKYSKGSSAHDAAANQMNPGSTQQMTAKKAQAEKERLKEELAKKKKFLMSIYGGDADDAEMARFVSAMKSKGKTKTWENDDEAFEGPGKEATKVSASKQKKKKKEPKVKIDVSAVPSRKAGANGSLVEQVHLKFEESSSEEDDEVETTNNASDYKKAFGSGGETDDEMYEEIGIDSQHDETETEEKEGDEAKKEETKTENDNSAKLSPELIAENGRLFVRNLSYSCTEDDLRALFEPFGPLTEVHMPIARETKKPKGFAYILFMIPEHALRAYSSLDGTIFQGRLLHILPSHEKPGRKDEVAIGTGSSFKQKQEKDLKEQAGKDYNWNSLFIRSDTILDAIAAQLGVEKSRIMDIRSSDNLATRLAVAETHLVQETKAYLESQGVQLDAFSSKTVSRSQNCILVKNLPFDTESREIRRLFEKFGTLGRVVLPPATKAIALVEFLEASEARTAFKGLAYSKFKNAPLYLEWAPMAALKPVEKSEALSEDNADSDQEETIVRVNAVKAEDLFESTGSTAIGTATLYVTNINWSTQPDTLKQVFSTAGPVKSVKLATKKDPKTGETLSLGFGFIEFDRKESMNRALDQLQGTVLDGHALILKKSTSGSTTSTETANKSKSKRRTGDDDNTSSETGTKLIIRNVPFEATEKDLKELFRSFAQLKRLRLPTRFNGQHRGFAFAEFLSHAEARQALQTLAHTHLYGRHLVLEWAKEDPALNGEEGEDVQAARSKAAKRSITASGGSVGGKRSKVILGDQDPDAMAQPFEDDDE